MLVVPLVAVLLATGAQVQYPPMHWHSWNTFCKENAVNEENMKQMADALISTGMAAAGYDMVNVVCNGWTGRHPTTHELTENRTNWPNGIRALANYLHAKSPPLKLGCYTSPATKNCCGEPGSLGYEEVDMNFFAKSGCDHVMVDWCRSYVSPAETKAEYAKIGKAIANSSNPSMMFGIWAGGMGKSWKWAKEVGGEYWRVSRDIKMYSTPQNTFDDGVLFNFDTAYSIPNIETHTSPGHFTFLDQMLVGVEPHGAYIVFDPLNSSKSHHLIISIYIPHTIYIPQVTSVLLVLPLIWIPLLRT
jgi:alpha-galactosidase